MAVLLTVVSAGMFVIGLLITYGGFSVWKRKRLIQDTPTETVRSAAAGRTELTGTGTALGEPLRRPFSDGVCLAAAYEIERWHIDDDGSDWQTVDRGTVAEPFQLDDGTGTMHVNADRDAQYHFEDAHTRKRTVERSEPEPDRIRQFLQSRSDLDGQPDEDGVICDAKRRYVEEWIPPDTELYLFGSAEPTDGSDTNSAGLVLRRDESADRFIVSSKGERELVDEARWQAPAWMAFGIAFSAFGLYTLLGSVGV